MANKFIKEADDFVVERVRQLKKYREKSGIEARWKKAEGLMKLDPIKAAKFEQNYEAQKVNLKTDDWQSDNRDLTPWMKVHIALSILGEQNPRAKFEAWTKPMRALAPFHSKVYNWSLNKEMFKYKLKRFIYDQAKYGVAFSCTKMKYDVRTVRDLVGIGPSGAEKYEDKTKVDYKGPWFKNLDPWQVYWDDSAEVFDKTSMNDWCYWDLLPKKMLKKKYPDIEWDKIPEESIDTDKKDGYVRPGMIKVWYYEIFDKDLMVIMANDKILDAYPIPYDHHRLSLNYAPFYLRDNKSVDGIGLPEVLSQDTTLLNKIRNMNVDQTVLSIYKSFFYDDTNEEDDVLMLQPGRGQKVLDPSKMKWVEVPAPGQAGLDREEMVRANMDDNTFSKILGGASLTGKTAFEIEQTKNASTRRLSSPIDGLHFALETDAHNRIDLLHQSLSNVDIEQIVDPVRAQAVMAVYKEYPEALKYDEANAIVYRYKYPELFLPLKKREDELVPSKEDNWFMLTPEGVRFEGDIKIDIKSTLLPTPELEKQQLVELSNLLIPLFAGDPAVNMKPAMQLLEQYDQDPQDWLPDSWLGSVPEPALPQGTDQPVDDGRQRDAGRVIPKTRTEPRSIVKKLGRMFSKVNPRVKDQ